MNLTKVKNHVENVGRNNRILLGICGTQLVANLLLCGLLGWTGVHQKTIIVPAEVSHAFSISDTQVDSSYLQQMATFFIYLRFNITPDNVDFQHGLIEQYLDPAGLASISEILNQESLEVKQDKISSQFYLSKVSVNPETLQAEVSGTLVKQAGNLSLPSEQKTYLIDFTYHYGKLAIKDFSEEETPSANNQ